MVDKLLSQCWVHAEMVEEEICFNDHVYHMYVGMYVQVPKATYLLHRLFYLHNNK